MSVKCKSLGLGRENTKEHAGNIMYLIYTLERALWKVRVSSTHPLAPLSTFIRAAAAAAAAASAAFQLAAVSSLLSSTDV